MGCMGEQTLQKGMLEYLVQDHAEFEKMYILYIAMTYIWKTQFKRKTEKIEKLKIHTFLLTSGTIHWIL